MKTTSKKPAAKKTSTSLLTRREKAAPKKAATRKAATKKAATKKPERGTVAWLIAELQKFPGDMYVLGSTVEVLPIKDGEIDEKRGENIVCITTY